MPSMDSAVWVPAFAGTTAFLDLAEHALEDGVDVLEVITEIELLLDLLVVEIALHIGVLLEQRLEVAFAAPDRHGVPLHELVGLLAACTLLSEREQQPLRMHEAAQAIEILLHVLGVDQQLVDQAGEAVEREVEGNRRIGSDHALDRGV